MLEKYSELVEIPSVTLGLNVWCREEGFDSGFVKHTFGPQEIWWAAQAVQTSSSHRTMQPERETNTQHDINASAYLCELKQKQQYCILIQILIIILDRFKMSQPYMGQYHF